MERFMGYPLEDQDKEERRLEEKLKEALKYLL